MVVDFLPTPSARLPPGLALHRSSAVGGAKKSGGGIGVDAAKLAHVWRPLRENWDWVQAGAEREH